MSFNWIDIVILSLLVLLIVRGWRAGFVLAAGRVVSLVVGIFVAAFTWPWIAEWTEGWGLGWWAVVVAFLIIVGLVSKILMLLFLTLDYVRRALSIIPFVSSINRLLGMAVGALEGIVLVMALVYIVALAAPGLFANDLAASRLYGLIAGFTYRATMLFPNFPFST